MQTQNRGQAFRYAQRGDNQIIFERTDLKYRFCLASIMFVSVLSRSDTVSNHFVQTHHRGQACREKGGEYTQEYTDLGILGGETGFSTNCLDPADAGVQTISIKPWAHS